MAQLTFAVLSAPMQPLQVPFDPPEHGTPYADLSKAQVDVTDDTTLREALVAALDQLGASLSATDVISEPIEMLGFIAFYKDEDEDGFAGTYSGLYDLRIVRDNGTVAWRQRPEDVTYADLRRTADAGLIDGDFDRPYLILHPPAGNGVVTTVVLLLVGLKYLTAVLSDVEGTMAFGGRVLEAIKRRAERGHDALDVLSVGLEDRGADAKAVFRLLEAKNWQTDDLAERLGCTPELAEALLAGFGYAQSGSGLWRRGDDEDAVFMQNALDVLTFTVEEYHATFATPFKERIAAYIQTGERPRPAVPYGLPENWWDMSPEEQQAWSEEHADEEDGMASNGLESLGLPLEQIDVRCACGKPECKARMSFRKLDDTLRLELEKVTDHFEVKPGFAVLVIDAFPEADV